MRGNKKLQMAKNEDGCTVCGICRGKLQCPDICGVCFCTRRKKEKECYEGYSSGEDYNINILRKYGIPITNN